MPKKTPIEVELAWAGEQEQSLVQLKLSSGDTVADAINSSSLLGRFPEIKLGQNRVGVHGRLVKLEHVLQAGDRIEIYRGLKVDPRVSRKRRARRRS